MSSDLCRELSNDHQRIARHRPGVRRRLRVIVILEGQRASGSIRCEVRVAAGDEDQVAAQVP